MVGALLASGTRSVPDTTESLLGWLCRTLRPRYVVIFLFVSVNLVALFVICSLAASRDNVVPPALVSGMQSRLDAKRLAEAVELAKGHPSLLGRVLAAGLSRLGESRGLAVAAMQEVAQHEATRIQQRLGYVALIAQLAPMFGLLGTVDGMVSAYGLMAAKDMAPSTAELAAATGSALVTTLVGLWIAIPAVAFYHIVRNRMNRLVAEAGIISEDLLRRAEVGNDKVTR
jgi:biopolymer transport protein ExbB